MDSTRIYRIGQTPQGLCLLSSVRDRKPYATPQVCSYFLCRAAVVKLAAGSSLQLRGWLFSWLWHTYGRGGDR